ncbi:dynamin family protein [Photobacterium iliopiscarium]|uniref:dynamin family protein n=1 Tax=Photobacterium iliopiscarium TaxID=56192 RepID=UPI00243108BC|nr:dynamin family protein [Photobacterium iliopiscarium]
MKNPKLIIKYNPFTVKSEFSLNDKKCNDFFELTKNKRLQHWIDKIFIELFTRYNCKTIEIAFIGTKLDAIDVQSAVDLFQYQYPNYQINLDDSKCKDVSVDEKLNNVKELFNVAQKGPFEAFSAPEMKVLFDKALSPNFEVTVLATMSAGKSTLINAMLGRELMPSKNEACTATISKVYDHDDMGHFVARRVVEGGKTTQWEDANLGLLDEWNAKEDTSIIEIKGNIPSIDERAGIRMVLVDTPGPNNSRDTSHREATIRAIRSSQPSMVLYVLNSTQLSTDDDKALLGLIKDVMAEGGREAQDRFIFIANKIDNFDPEKGESVTNALKNVRNYLKENGIENPLVIPVSAELTKLLRIQKAGGKLTRSQRGNLSTYEELFIEEPEMNMLEQAKGDLSSGLYQELNSQLKDAVAKGDDVAQAELLSGLPIVEKMLSDYISKHALPSRIKDAVDVFRYIDSENKISEDTLKTLESSEFERGNIVQQIENFENDKGRLDQAVKFRKKLNDMTYKMSLSATADRTNIDKKFNAAMDEIETYFQNDVSPQDAERVFDIAKRKVDLLISEIQVLLEESVGKEQISVLDQLRNEYQQYVADILKNAFPDDCMSSVKNIQASVLNMPDAADIILSATYDKTHEVCTGTERHGFLWLRKRNTYKTVHEEKVDMSVLATEFSTNLQEHKIKQYKNANKQMEIAFDHAKTVLLMQMSELDSKMNESMRNLKQNMKDQGKLDNEIKVMKENLDWYESFKVKLNSVLDL